MVYQRPSASLHSSPPSSLLPKCTSALGLGWDMAGALVVCVPCTRRHCCLYVVHPHLCSVIPDLRTRCFCHLCGPPHSSPPPSMWTSTLIASAIRHPCAPPPSMCTSALVTSVVHLCLCTHRLHCLCPHLHSSPPSPKCTSALGLGGDMTRAIVVCTPSTFVCVHRCHCP
jgi:hypothetical protein